MKNLTLIILLLFGLLGCTQQGPPAETIPPATQATLETTMPEPEPTEGTMPTESIQPESTPTYPPETEPMATAPAETQPIEPTPTEPSIEVVEPEVESTEPPTEVTEPETLPTEPEPTELEPTEQEPAEPGPTEPKPTEPTRCSHDWVYVSYGEVGHWEAGIVCDCGWTAYGEPNSLVDLWNSHSASFSPEESLFLHGGYGSVDQWIVDTPAYDEWVCRHCGEPKA